MKITTYDTTRFFGPFQGLSDNDCGTKRLLDWHLIRFYHTKIPALLRDWKSIRRKISETRLASRQRVPIRNSHLKLENAICINGSVWSQNFCADGCARASFINEC